MQLRRVRIQEGFLTLRRTCSDLSQLSYGIARKPIPDQPFPSRTRVANSTGHHFTAPKSVLLCGIGRGVVFVDHSALHHENNAAHGGHILQGITIKSNDVGLQSRREPADLVRHVHRLGGK